MDNSPGSPNIYEKLSCCPLCAHALATPHQPLAYSTVRRRHWAFINNGCVHGIQRSDTTITHSGGQRSVVQDTIAVLTLSKAFALIAALAMAVALGFLWSGCLAARPQKGGQASSLIARPGQTNLATLAQPENPKETSRQTVQSQRTLEYVLPPGTAIALGDTLGDRSSKLGVRRPQTPKSSPGVVGRRSEIGDRDPRTTSFELPSFAPPAVAVLDQPMPVRVSASDRTETTIGAGQKDTARELAAKATSVQPVMWAGIIMMTVVAGALAYFGWWTKAGVAVAVGLAMIVLAGTLPAHGTLILLAGLGVFALAALLVLYAYSKGQLDQNHNAIPDFLERGGKTAA